MKGNESNEQIFKALDAKVENLNKLMADYSNSDNFQRIIDFTRSAYAEDKIGQILEKYGKIRNAEELPDAGGITEDANKWIIVSHYDIRVLYTFNQNNDEKIQNTR